MYIINSYADNEVIQTILSISDMFISYRIPLRKSVLV